MGGAAPHDPFQNRDPAFIPGGFITRLIAAALVAACSVTSLSAGSARDAFARSWVGRRVVVQAPIYSLVFNERGRFGTSRTGQREGLTLVTASGAALLQFDGRQGRDTVVQEDPRQVVAAVNAAYEGDVVDVRTYRKLEALRVTRHDPGVGLVVAAARVGGDVIRLDLANAPGGEPVTSLRVRWPVPISSSFDERDAVEAVIARYLAAAP